MICMKVLVLNHYNRLSPRVDEEIKSLVNESWQVNVVSWARCDKTATSTLCADVHHEIIRFPAPAGCLRLLFFVPWFYLALIYKLSKVRCNVVHCTHLILLPFSIFWGKLHRMMVVYDVYEFHLEEYKGTLKVLKPLEKMLCKLEQILVSKVDLLLTIDSVSGELKKYYQQFNNNVVVIYNVPSLNRSAKQETPKALKEQFSERRVVTYVGGLSKIKGALKALESIDYISKRISNVLFLFIGMFHNDMEKIFWRYVQEHHLEPYVEYISWLPYEKMLRYLYLAKVGLAVHQPFPRFFRVSKGNGRKFFTYMQASVPIVGPNFGEIGQVVREENCGILVDTTDPKQIAEAIIYLLEHPQEAKAMGNRGRKAVEEKYNWDREKEKLLRAYRQLEGKISG